MSRKKMRKRTAKRTTTNKNIKKIKTRKKISEKVGKKGHLILTLMMLKMMACRDRQALSQPIQAPNWPNGFSLVPSARQSDGGQLACSQVR